MKRKSNRKKLEEDCCSEQEMLSATLYRDVFHGKIPPMKLREVITYEHHGNKVKVRKDLRGKHRQHCLCYHCKYYSADRKKNCPISNAVYANCVKYGLVTPVWECPEFEQIGDIYTTV
jgi:hypothetical protein